MSITTIRAVITGEGGTPASYAQVPLVRELITQLGGTPTQYGYIPLLRELVTEAGGTPTQQTTTGLLRELVTALGGTPATYSDDALWTQVLGLGFVPPDPYGPELITNGTFASDVAGWSNLGSGTTTFSSGKLRVTSAGSDNGAKQIVLSLDIGATYRFQATQTPSETDRARIRISIGTTENYYFAVVGGTIDDTFVPSGAGIDIVMEAASAAAWASSGQYAEFDNVSLKKVL